VLYSGSITELSGAPSENRRVLYRQNEVQKRNVLCFQFYRRLPKLAVQASVNAQNRPYMIT